jgi:hypothetical protein
VGKQNLKKMATILCNYSLDFNQEVVWEACNGATRTRLKIINKTSLQGRMKSFEASLGTYENGRNSFIFLNKSKSGDNRILGLFLNAAYGFTVREGRELFSASSVGGYGNSESKIAVYELGALVEVHTYKDRRPSTFYRLTENGWVEVPNHEVISADIAEI